MRSVLLTLITVGLDFDDSRNIYRALLLPNYLPIRILDRSLPFGFSESDQDHGQTGKM
jgi:hypothetical protein